MALVGPLLPVVYTRVILRSGSAHVTVYGDIQRQISPQTSGRGSPTCTEIYDVKCLRLRRAVVNSRGPTCTEIYGGDCLRTRWADVYGVYVRVMHGDLFGNNRETFALINATVVI